MQIAELLGHDEQRPQHDAHRLDDALVRIDDVARAGVLREEALRWRFRALAAEAAQSEDEQVPQRPADWTAWSSAVKSLACALLGHEQAVRILADHFLGGAELRFPDTVAAWFDDTCLSILFCAADDRVLATHVARDAPLYEQDVVEVFLAPADPREYFEIEVSPRGIYMLNGRQMSLDQVAAALAVANRANPNMVVYIRADQEGPYRVVAAILDRCEKLGIARSLENVNLSPDARRSILMTSPRPICPVAMRFDIGYTRCRSIARLR